jgi:TrmH family RNA methyltransferase
MEPLSKARIKLIQSLQHKKFRLKYDKFIVEGLKITSELIKERPSMVEEVYISNPDYQTILKEIMDNKRLCQVTPQQMHQISQMSTPPGVLAVCSKPHEAAMPESISGKRMFYLDSIRDPGNLGTILRIADWFGLDFVILSTDSVDIYNHKVLQASMGSALRVKTTTLDKVGLMSIGEGKLYVCDAEGKSIHTINPPSEGIIVLSNESLGVSSDIMHQVKEVLAIPGDRSLGAESLNVASAAAIVAAWWRR